MDDALSPEQREAFLRGPAGPPPAGQVSNFDDPPNLSSAGHAIFLTLWGVATICFFIRLYAKAVVVRKWRLSDFVMILAWTLCMGYSSVVLLVGRISPGVDQWNLRLKDFIELLYYEQIGLILFGVCSFFIKLSILIQLLEVFSHGQRDYFFWSCHGLIWLNFLYYSMGALITIFRCRPIPKAWNLLITNGKCMDNFRLIVVASAINAVSDIMIFILPQLRIWRLQLATHKKLALSAIFSFGLMACAFGVIKLVYAVLMNTRTNTSYYMFLMGLWTLPEMAGGMIAGVSPPHRRSFKAWQKALS
ncbi:hypothetical protein BDW66DRAFT_150459 [Aspergillus desertorum]